MSEVPWLDARQERAWRALQLMQMRLDGELARRLVAESGLSYADYVVLVALTDEPDGRLRPYQLAHLLGWEKSRLSHHVTRMGARDLVSRESCPSDKRGSFVVITPRGRKEIEAAAPGHARAVRDLFVDLLAPSQLDLVGDVADTILEALDEAGA